MGQTKEQYVGGLANEVAWLGWRDRLRILWALRPWHYATDSRGRKVTL